MKRLLLLRHAKAVPRDAKLSDRARPLAERGRGDAFRVGKAMRGRRYLPDHVLCSSARRTVETWECLAPALETAPAPKIIDSLYDASAKRILKIVRAADDRAAAVLVIGHNPAIEELAALLAARPASPASGGQAKNLAAKFPTCALAVLDFDTMGWSELASAPSVLTDFLRPIDLTEN